MELRNYQRRAIAWLEETPRALLAAKPGAGKTAIVIRAIEGHLFNRFASSAVLVVAPKRVVPQWPQEGATWGATGLLRFAEYLGTPKQREAALGAILSGKANVLVAGRDVFVKLVASFAADKWPFGMVAFDESDRLKSAGRQGSQSYRAMYALARKTQSEIVLVSGTIMPENLEDLYGPMSVLDGGQSLGRTLTAFRDRYMEPDKVDRRRGIVFSYRAKEGAQEEVTKRIRHLVFAISPDLGIPHVVIDKWVRLPAKVVEQIRALRKPMVGWVGDAKVVAASRGVLEGKLLQLCNGAVFTKGEKWEEVHTAKIDALRDLLDELQEPVLVVAWFQHDKERILAAVPEAVDLARGDALERAKQGLVRVGVINPASAGHGVDGLQKHFSAMIWFSMTTSNGLYEQTVRRIVRSGTRAETVRIYRILAKDGFADKRALRSLAVKARAQDKLYQDMDSSGVGT